MRDENEVGVLIHFKGVEPDEEVKAHLESRCRHLAEEFHETTRYELTLEVEHDKLKAHGHVTGKNTDAAAHTGHLDGLRVAGDALLEKLHTELRRLHDKRIFTQRRREQKRRAERSA